jgi:hypothetical protein
MALKACIECGTEISAKAATCPKCGAPVKSAARAARGFASKVWLAIKLFVALIFGLIVYQCSAGISKEADASRPASVVDPAPIAKLATPIQAAAPAPPTTLAEANAWEYRTTVDALSKKETKLATLTSVDQLALDFPYRGRNFGNLGVRQSPRNGLNAYFTIEKGQLICGFGEGECRIKIAFDSAPPSNFNMSRAADGDSTVLFFNDAKRFIRAASAAKEIRVAAVVYQAGEPTLTFRASHGLVWPMK